MTDQYREQLVIAKGGGTRAIELFARLIVRRQLLQSNSHFSLRYTG